VSADTQPVRRGEELDLERLAAWLRGLGIDGEIAVTQFPGGHSNLTYLVRVGDRELVLRRPPFGTKVKTAHDMGREYKILQHITEKFPAPRPLAYCDDPGVLGAPFYLMERLTGTILRKEIPPQLSPELAPRLAESFVATLARLHALDWRALGLDGKPEGYVARQVSGWTKRWHDARTDEIPDAERVSEWLAANLPGESGAALIHNDFKFDNLILDEGDWTRVVGVLDWEMATIGDPLMDLGTALSYWTQADDPEELQAFRFGPTTVPGMPIRRELAARYFALSGRPVEDLTFYYVFALFKNVGVAQQIYYRWKAGLTKDDRFAGFLDGVKALAHYAARAIERGM
jgi:aminoglycoside phosphotransferase (APT) family kinase protein